MATNHEGLRVRRSCLLRYTTREPHLRLPRLANKYHQILPIPSRSLQDPQTSQQSGQRRRRGTRLEASSAGSRVRCERHDSGTYTHQRPHPHTLCYAYSPLFFDPFPFLSVLLHLRVPFLSVAIFVAARLASLLMFMMKTGG